MSKHHSVELECLFIKAYDSGATIGISIPFLKKSPGRRPILGGELDGERLVNKVKSDNRLALHQTTGKLLKPVSKDIVRRVLHKERDLVRKAVRKPPLDLGWTDALDWLLSKMKNIGRGPTGKESFGLTSLDSKWTTFSHLAYQR
ncbi:hypothetical protein EDD11_008354 [Mortierella claussenii]|nr:hypothetical protein EDD11_008354 [Mortierella claussenii]